jgi:putative glycosyltransferase
MRLSIVATLYRSEAYLAEFHERASRAARQLVGDSYEIVLVNDGSPDNSLELAVWLTHSDAHVVVVDLSRNFGHHKAMMAGLAHARGEQVFLIDSDLEEEPEWLLEFAKIREREGADVVYGVQEARKGGWFERWSGEFFYTLFNWLSHIDHPRNIVTARLMTQRYVRGLLLHSEREMVISCLWVITGFKQYGTRVVKNSSEHTTYTLRKKLSHFVNAVTSFSSVPLRLIFYFGIVVFLVSLLFSAYLVLNKILFAQPLAGWTSVMMSIWILGGMVISFIGIIGIYLSKIFLETKGRPTFIVRDVYGREER